MGSQRLSPRSVRRIAKATGEEIAFAVGHGGMVHEFVTEGHRHGWFNIKSGEWGWDEDPLHFTSCDRWLRRGTTHVEGA